MYRRLLNEICYIIYNSSDPRMERNFGSYIHTYIHAPTFSHTCTPVQAHIYFTHASTLRPFAYIRLFRHKHMHTQTVRCSYLHAHFLTGKHKSVHRCISYNDTFKGIKMMMESKRKKKSLARKTLKQEGGDGMKGKQAQRKEKERKGIYTDKRLGFEGAPKSRKCCPYTLRTGHKKLTGLMHFYIIN